ncbi:sodium:proton antiporter [Telmatocola sphagniphila]|uniref:Sodium:proton antiporter n=1 Tax=Telmatocola sphagniphila TaxID=1123043 RepID=A0A8E6B3V1_9BACT|nr:sodium:proton antiporter [Telmatocola sphagniphila]QVL31216.1 sodium:proton antiporter [Telmatocola sphagniphila]
MSVLWGAAEAHNLDVAALAAAPFALILLCIAVLPLVAEHWWHSNRNKAIVSGLLALPVVIYLLAINEASGGESVHRLLHELEEYASFIILLFSLYTISGGIVVFGDIEAKPRTNVALLALGAVLANFIGTTGASMILIRPLLRINSERDHKTHLPIFFIFLVSNTGGLLTPLGDPPLFLGFLKGVDFFWTLSLWPYWLLVNLAILAIFYVWDIVAYRKESRQAIRMDEAIQEPIKLRGWGVNAPLLFGVLLAVILQSPVVGAKLGALIGVGDLTLQKPFGEILMLILAGISLMGTPKGLRHQNDFSWVPIVEVAVLFIGIFITMVPALALLDKYGDRIQIDKGWQYLWLTGLLSSFLDNAPTYVTMGTLASNGHDLGWLMTNKPNILSSISCGAVFMGALTYIGNGPNFMVKSIAEHSGYSMPSFLGYMAYSFGVLIPLFLVLTFLLA